MNNHVFSSKKQKKTQLFKVSPISITFIWYCKHDQHFKFDKFSLHQQILLDTG